MTRDMFYQVALTALRRQQGHSLEAQAEAVTAAVEAVMLALGETPIAGAPPPEPVPRPAFPSVNPAAVAPAAPAAPQPDPYQPPPEQPSLIIPATSIPDKIERQPAPKAKMLRAPVMEGRMKVEQLNQLVQDNTPQRLPVDVPMEDGAVRRMWFERNVISQHGFDSVQLVYYPARAMPTARESMQVQRSISIDDLPFDLDQFMRMIQEEAADRIRPRGAPREVPVRGFSGAVHSSAGYSDATPAAPSMADLGQAETIMGTGAGVTHSDYVAPKLPSEFHPSQRIPPEFRQP